MSTIARLRAWLRGAGKSCYTPASDRQRERFVMRGPDATGKYRAQIYLMRNAARGGATCKVHDHVRDR